MRTLILALTVLLFAAPVWATVTIEATADAGNPRKFVISYTSDETELIRAFALNIVATDGNVIDVNDYAVGDDNGGFGIFPGTFAAANVLVNPTTGEVDNWAVDGYSPVAPAGDPDAEGGIGTPGVTIEMGSLYDTAAPGNSGILCSVTFDDDATEFCITANAIRGNVVLESAAEVQSLVLPDCPIDIGDIDPDCIAPDHLDYGMWVSRGKPQCWCPAGTGDINGAPSRGLQCKGDADNAAQWGIYEVFTDDLAVLAGAWKKLLLAPEDRCADFDHLDQWGIYPVFTDDLAILAAGWKALVGGLGAADCMQ